MNEYDEPWFITVGIFMPLALLKNKQIHVDIYAALYLKLLWQSMWIWGILLQYEYQFKIIQSLQLTTAFLLGCD